RPLAAGESARLEDLRDVLSPAPGLEGGVDRDAKDPGPQARLVPEVLELPEERREDFLADVLRLVPVADDPSRQVEDLLPVVLDEALGSTRVSPRARRNALRWVLLGGRGEGGAPPRRDGWVGRGRPAPPGLQIAALGL